MDDISSYKYKFKNRVNILNALPKIICIILLILSIISGIVVAAIMYRFWIFLVIAAGGTLSALIIKWLMELAIAPKLLALVYLEEISEKKNDTVKAPKEKVYEPQNTVSSINNPIHSKKVDEKPKGDLWVCPKCGYKNGEALKFCGNCYEKRI